MKKVYLAVGKLDYEGEYVLSVFEDKLDAHEWLLLNVNDRPNGFDSYEVQSVELKEKRNG
jgi:hypothetical protein